ncbi:MAG: oligosaccharide flippase family protein [Bacteriovoracaceae bacterium]|nr:oligosaccharide flippase family protein [Bacteriovoracaceae bacterium]
MSLISSVLERKNIMRWMGYLFSFNAFAFLCTFLTTRIFTRWYSPEDYAVIGKFIFIITFSLSFLSGWLLPALSRYVPERVAQQKSTGPIFQYILKISIIPVCIMVLLALVFHKELENYFGILPSPIFLLIPVLLSSYVLILSMLQTLNQFGHVTMLKIFERILYLLMAIFIAYVFYLKDPLYFLNFTLGKLIITFTISLLLVWCLPQVRSSFRNVKDFLSSEQKRDMLRFVIPCFFSMLISISLNWIDFFMVSLLKIDLDTGHYFFAQQVLNMMIAVAIVPFAAISPKLMQYLSGKNTDKISDYIHKFIPLLHVCWLSMIIFVMIFINPIIGNFFSEKYMPSAWFIRILLVGQSGMIISQCLILLMNHQKRSTRVTMIFAGTFIVNIVLAILLTPLYQAKGICIAKAISILILYIMTLVFTPSAKKFIRWYLLPLTLVPMALFFILNY